MSTNSNMKERIAVLETKVDSLTDVCQEVRGDVKEGRTIQGRIETNLAEHMRRTELLEKGQELWTKRFYAAIGVLIVFEVLSKGGPDALVKIVPFALKLFGL
jgi:hypothetical protein